MNIYRQFCRCWLACLLLLSFHLHAGAATLFQWSFDGPPGTTLSSSTDSVACVVVTKFNDATLSAGATNTIKYGPPNPWYNHNGTSADFQNTVGVNDPGAGLFVNDSGVNCPLDLTTLTHLTIEGFFYPYDIRIGVLIGNTAAQVSGKLSCMMTASLASVSKVPPKAFQTRLSVMICPIPAINGIM